MDTSKCLKIFIILGGFVFGFNGCKSIKYETKTAYTYKISPYHWGRGYYKQDIYYKFEYKGDTVRNIYRHPQLYSLPPVNSGIIQIGDSLLVEFPVNKPEKAKVTGYFNAIRNNEPVKVYRN